MSPTRTVTVDQLSSNCRAKLDWADKHLDALNREADRWGDGNPFTIRRESNADGSEHVFYVDFNAPLPVWRCALLLGDALHNLRCALDHIVYALAIAQTGKDPPDGETQLQFPIASEPKFFDRQRRRIAALNQPTQAAIERLQPYNRLKPRRGGFMPLWLLSALHDIDKHRLPHIAATAAHPDDIAIDAEPGTYQALWNTGYLEDGAPILRVLLTEPNPNVYVDLKATGAVVLQLEGWTPMSIYWATQHMRREVHVACRYLSQFFPAEVTISQR